MLIRQCGVIVDWETGELLRPTTEQFRLVLEERAATAW
jgi:N-methylhydantoinase B